MYRFLTSPDFTALGKNNEFLLILIVRPFFCSSFFFKYLFLCYEVMSKNKCLMIKINTNSLIIITHILVNSFAPLKHYNIYHPGEKAFPYPPLNAVLAVWMIYFVHYDRYCELESHCILHTDCRWRVQLNSALRITIKEPTNSPEMLNTPLERDRAP